MEKKLNRNDLCYCGSGNKFKNCHMNKAKAETTNRSFVIIGALVLLSVIAVLSVYFSLQERPKSNNAINQSNSNAPVPPPPGEAPPGKVWSTAHGHWHDI
jgi:hypothetical protein